MDYVTGIDVSEYQGTVDWNKARSAGCQFAFIRCTFGVKIDPRFKQNWKAAKQAGIARGAYGWCIDKMNQVSNATLFCKQIEDDPGELPPVVDFEKYGATWVGFSALQLYVETVEKLLNKKPIIYSSYGYWSSLKDYKNQFWALQYPYWHAQYTTAEKPNLPLPFAEWQFWQYSADGNHKGKEFGVESDSVDIDRFNGDSVDFHKYLGGEVIEPEPDIPIPPGITDLDKIKMRLDLVEAKSNKLETWAKGIGYKG